MRLCSDRANKTSDSAFFRGNFSALAALADSHAVARAVHGFDHALIDENDLAVDFRDGGLLEFVQALEADHISRNAAFWRWGRAA